MNPRPSSRSIRLVRAHWITGYLFAALIPFVSGCSSYGEVGNVGYDYAKALFSITNRQSTEQLESIATQIEHAESSGSLSTQEAAWLNEIIDLSESGEWTQANKNCRKLMERQIAKK